MILSFVRAVDSYSWFGLASHPIIRTWKSSKNKKNSDRLGQNCTQLFFSSNSPGFRWRQNFVFFFLMD